MLTISELTGFNASSGLAVPTTGLWGWWEATQSYTETSGTPSTLITSDATAVGSVLDLSGNGHHLYQTNASYKPTYKTGIKNGYPAWYNSGSANIQLVGSTGQPSKPVSVYCVFYGTSWVSFKSVWGNSLGTTDILLYTPSSGNLALLNGAASGATVAVSSSTWYLHAGMINATTTVTARLDAGSDVTSTITTATSAEGNMTILGAGSAGSSSTMYGYLLEVIAYTNTTHNFASGDGLLVRQYLDTKYALGLGI